MGAGWSLAGWREPAGLLDKALSKKIFDKKFKRFLIFKALRVRYT